MFGIWLPAMFYHGHVEKTPTCSLVELRMLRSSRSSCRLEAWIWLPATAGSPKQWTSGQLTISLAHLVEVRENG